LIYLAENIFRARARARLAPVPTSASADQRRLAAAKNCLTCAGELLYTLYMVNGAVRLADSR